MRVPRNPIPDDGNGRDLTAKGPDWLAVDGSVESSEGRVMVWTEDGFLAQVDDGPLQ